jgi:hypothetical protein
MDTFHVGLALGYWSCGFFIGLSVAFFFSAWLVSEAK